MVTLSRNDSCHCGSGKKYKKCHMQKDQEAESKALKKIAFKTVNKKNEAEALKKGSKPVTPSRKNWWDGLVDKARFLRKKAAK